MNTPITIEEIVKLDKARTQGEWRRGAGCVIHLGEDGQIYDEGGHDISDAAFIAASPRIAALAIEQDQKLRVIEPGFFKIMEYVQGCYNDGAKWTSVVDSGIDSIIKRCKDLESENIILKQRLLDSNKLSSKNEGFADKFSNSLVELDAVNKELVAALNAIISICCQPHNFTETEEIADMAVEALKKVGAL